MKYSWNDFVKRAADLYISGKDEGEISKEFSGDEIVGLGIVDNIDTDPKYTQFIQVVMPRIEIPYKDKVIVCDFICLNFEKLTENDVRGLKSGRKINFTTELVEGNGPFPGISMSEFEEDEMIIIMPGTKNSVIHGPNA